MAAFLLDHNVAREIGDNLRDMDYGVPTAPERGMERAGDWVRQL
ncbi:MAG TPA: hypothetical protein VIU62_12830 [Chloroflexota bacterium]